MAERVDIYEVGPRDGLQNEPRPIATDDKVKLIDLLSDVGFSHIEAASFVSPKWVPQMADAAAVLRAIRRRPSVTYAALTPNLQGYEGARQAGAGEVAVFASASEGFSRRNINCSIAESFERFAPVFAAADRDGVPVRGYVSCVIACPYDGATPPEAVAEVAARLLALGCREVSLGDTIGAGTAQMTAALLDRVLGRVPAERVAGHFHDTRGEALACIDTALGKGLRVFDAALGGAGGCPYAPGAPGNVSTGAVEAFLSARGFETGLDRERLDEAEAFMSTLLRRAR